jgi:hypothetical protein
VAQAVAVPQARQPSAPVAHCCSCPPLQELAPGTEHPSTQAEHAVAEAQLPDAHAVVAPQARQPLASATQVRTSPPAHAVAPAVAQLF